VNVVRLVGGTTDPRFRSASSRQRRQKPEKPGDDVASLPGFALGRVDSDR
jgi:hypothetical protein